MKEQIVIGQSFAEWRWRSNPGMVALFLNIICMAKEEETEEREMTCERGSFITTLVELAKVSGLSIQQVRTCLNRFVRDGKLTIKSTNKHSKITVCEYESYKMHQHTEQQTKQQTEGKSKESPLNPPDVSLSVPLFSLPPIIPQERSHSVRVKETLEDRQTFFYNSLKQYVKDYGKKTIREFYDHWTEMKPNGKKMRFEMERTFDIKKRLNTWIQRDYSGAYAEFLKEKESKKTIARTITGYQATLNSL